MRTTSSSRRLAAGSFCLSLALLTVSPASAATLYVKPGGNDTQPGNDWVHAKATISAAVAAAQDGDEIWVAAGDYAEHVRIEPPGQEQPVANVALYGGFLGVESQRTQRDPVANRTTINGTNSGITVLISGGASAATRIDGFQVTGGNGLHGGGIKIVGSAPVIENNVIRLNLANGLGAGISVWGGRIISTSQAEYARIARNTIVDNLSYEEAGDGGGIGINYASPEIHGNVIARNRANQNGGGIAIYNNSAPFIHNNFILANTANFLNGGSSCSIGGGGVFATAWDVNCEHVEFAISAPVIADNVIAANGAWLGGGVILISTDGTPVLANNTLVANSGAAVHWEESGLTLVNNLVAFNSTGLKQVVVGTTNASLSHNNVFGNALQHRDTNYIGLGDQTGLDGNMSAEPLLTNHAIGEFHLQPGSPCIGAGDDPWVRDPADIDGDARILGGSVDIGADEFDGTDWDGTPPVVFVRPGGDDANDGSTWALAKSGVAAGIAQAASRGGEVWVAAGTYQAPAEGPFVMPAFVQVYGGFAGTESSRDQRDWTAHPVVLDGGARPPVVRFENAGYRVSRLDGVTVQNGGKFLDGTLSLVASDYVLAQGGGIVAWVNGPEIANSTIRHNAVGSPFTSGVVESGSGAGMAGYLSTAVIVSSTVEDNEVWNNIAGNGGGVYFERSQPAIEASLFRRNHAEHGSAMSFYGRDTVAYVAGNTIEDHWMYFYWAVGLESNYGAVVCSLCDDMVLVGNVLRNNRALTGAAALITTSGKARVESNLFLDNTAVSDESGLGGWGGGVFVQLGSNATGDVRIVNNTFVGNTASPGWIYADQGGAISVWGLPIGLGSSDAVVIANNIMADNSSAVVLNLYTAVGVRVEEYNLMFNNTNINLVPDATDLFADPAFAAPGVADFRPARHSPAVDAGSAAELPVATLDAGGSARLAGPRVDVGAYELPAFAGLSALADAGGSGTVGVSAVLWDVDVRRQLAHVVSGLGGSGLAVVSLTPESVKGQAAVGDVNGNGSDDLAVLTVAAGGFVEVKVKDGLSGALLSRMSFEPAYRPLWLRVVPATGTGGVVELAVLGVDAAGRPRAQLRDALTGALVSKVPFEAGYAPFGFEVIRDVDGGGEPELAVLGVDGVGRVRAQVKDAVTGQLVARVYFDRSYKPTHAAGVDMDGDGTSDALAVLGKNAAGVLRAQVKDVATAVRLGNVRFESGYAPHALVSLADLNGTGSPELAVLQSDARGRVRAQVKDAVTAQPVSVVPFSNAHAPRDLVVLPDVNGNGHAELGYLGEGPAGSYLLQVKDAASGAALASTTLP